MRSAAVDVVNSDVIVVALEGDAVWMRVEVSESLLLDGARGLTISARVVKVCGHARSAPTPTNDVKNTAHWSRRRR